MKKINFLFNVIIAFGIFMILGTAGGSDMGEVTVSEIFTFTLSGIALIFLGRSGKAIVNKLLTPPRKTPAMIKRLPVSNRNIAA